MKEEGSQFIIVTHSPILLGLPNVDIYMFDDNGIELCSYEDTDCYKIMEMFINNRESFLKRLFA